MCLIKQFVPLYLFMVKRINRLLKEAMFVSQQCINLDSEKLELLVRQFKKKCCVLIPSQLNCLTCVYVFV